MGRQACSLLLCAVAGAPCACKQAPPPAPVDTADAAAPAPSVSQIFLTIPVVSAAPPPTPPPPAYGPEGSTFEGEMDITVKTFTAKGPMTAAVFVKGDQTCLSRTFVTAKRSIAEREINRLSEGRAYIVIDTLKSFESYRLRAAPPDTKVTHTGKLERIAGAQCEDWEMVSQGGHFSACVVSGLGSYMLAKDYPAAWQWTGVLAAQHYFALRASMTDGAGNELQSVLVTRIVRKSVPDDKFTYPPEYVDAEIAEQQAAAQH